MKHCFIVPTAYINSFVGDECDFLLILSHLLDQDCSNEYAQAIFKRKEKFPEKEIIMDNGLYENLRPELPRDLRLKAHKMKVDSVFAPDHLFQTIKTKEALFEFIELKKELEIELNATLPEVNYVIQAYNRNDYAEEFKAAQDYPIKLIGLSILAVPKSFQLMSGTKRISVNRAIALGYLDRYCEVKKPVHLLGLGEGLADIIVAKQLPWVVSNDSCLAFHVGFKGFERGENGVLVTGKPLDKLNFDLPMDDRFIKNERQIRSNINIIHTI